MRGFEKKNSMKVLIYLWFKVVKSIKFRQLLLIAAFDPTHLPAYSWHPQLFFSPHSPFFITTNPTFFSLFSHFNSQSKTISFLLPSSTVSYIHTSIYLHTFLGFYTAGMRPLVNLLIVLICKYLFVYMQFSRFLNLLSGFSFWSMIWALLGV